MRNKKQGFHYAFLIFIGCCCVSAGSLAMTISLAGIYLLPVSTSLGVNPGDFALWLVISGAVSIAALPVWGRLVQTRNINLVATAGALFMVVGMFGMSRITQTWQAWFFGGCIGLGLPEVFTVLIPTLIGNWFAKEKRGRFLGIAAACSGVGLFFWAPLFTFILQTADYHAAYTVNALIMAVLLLPWTLFVFKLKPEDKGLQPYGCDPSRTDEEKDAASPLRGISARAALRTPVFWAMLVAIGCASFGIGFNGNQPAIATEFLAGILDPQSAAMFGAAMISASALADLLGKVTLGWLVDAIGVRLAFLAYLVLFASSFTVWLIFSGQGALLVGAFLLGTHNALPSVGFPLLVRALFGNRDYPKIFSRLMMANAFAGGFGIPILVYLSQLLGGYRPVLLLGIALVVLVALAVFYAISRIGKLTESEDAIVVSG